MSYPRYHQRECRFERMIGNLEPLEGIHVKYGRVAIFVLAFIALGAIFLQLKTPTVAAAADGSPFAKNFSLVDKDGNIAGLMTTVISMRRSEHTSFLIRPETRCI